MSSLRALLFTLAGLVSCTGSHDPLHTDDPAEPLPAVPDSAAPDNTAPDNPASRTDDTRDTHAAASDASTDALTDHSTDHSTGADITPSDTRSRDATSSDVAQRPDVPRADALPLPSDAAWVGDAAAELLDPPDAPSSDDVCWPVDRAQVEDCAHAALAEIDLLGVSEPEQQTLRACLSDTVAADAWYAACDDRDTEPACVIGFDAWFDAPLARCRDTLADAQYDRTCVFGRWWGTVDEQRAIHRVSGARAIYPVDLDGVRLDQAVAALHSSGYTAVSTAAEVLDTVQDDGVLFETWWDTSARRRFESVTYGLGDNTYGAVFWADSTAIAARIRDSDIEACGVAWGPHTRRCASVADCGDAELCTGFGAGGEGRCVAPRLDPELRGMPCLHGAEGACPDGLLCMGASGSATCEPPWMHGVFADHSVAPVLASLSGGTAAQIDVTGLGTVATSAWVDVRVDHPRAEQLTGYVESPSGTRYAVDTLLAQSGGWGGQWLPVPGDEPANGAWTLVVADTLDDEASGWRVRWSLELSSRWD